MDPKRKKTINPAGGSWDGRNKIPQAGTGMEGINSRRREPEWKE